MGRLSKLEELKIKVEEEGADPVMPDGNVCPVDTSPIPSSRIFTDVQLKAHLRLHRFNVDAAAYDICLRKARDTSLRMGNLTIADQSEYWLRRAAFFRPNFSGNAPRADDIPRRRQEGGRP